MGYERFTSLEENIKHGDYMLPFVEYGTFIPEIFTSFPMHWHHEFEIIKVNFGILEINIDLKNYIAKAGDIIIISPCMLHSFKQYNNEKMGSNTLMFHMRILGTLITDACSIKYLNPFIYGEYSFNPILSPETEGYQMINDSFNSLLQIYKTKGKFYELKLKSELFQLFYGIFESLLKKDISELKVKNDVVDSIKIVLDYIKDNYKSQIQIEDLAKLLNFSKSHFMRFFKNNIGITAIEYINNYRLNVAAQLLLSTDIKVKEVSEEVGIYNLSYFYRQFKKMFDLSPNDYRKK